jgi:hypothetical protein
MRSVCIFFLVISFSVVASAQGWRAVNQTDFNVKYKLPTSWEVDGFGGGFGYWNEGGSSVCDCAGTINYGYDRTLGMVLYPFEIGSNGKKRENVWGYHFVPSTSVQTVTAKKIAFQRVISKWELNSGSDEYMGMLDDVVWQLTAKTEKYGLIIYFWGDASLMLANEKEIYKILDSMVMVKR